MEELMAKTFDKADPDVHEIIRSILKKYHSPLEAAGLTVDCVMASNFDKDGEPLPAIKAHGANASAKIKATSLEDRIRGLGDVRLTIDRHVWAHATPNQRKAIIDHELHHVTLKDEGELGDDGRPKLKMREHDWTTWGFAVIAERYKDDAPEVSSMKAILAEHFSQLELFPNGGKE
jgi:hypothetical protein